MEKTDLICKNIRIGTHRTSMRLESGIWSALDEISHRERCDVNDICDHVNQHRPDTLSLTAAVRLFTINYFRGAATEEGHMRAGHGISSSIVKPPASLISSRYEPQQRHYMMVGGQDER